MEDFQAYIENRDGWWWPAHDKGCWNYMNMYPNLPTEISEYVPEKNVVVQAGGNCGFYPKQYAKLFKTVYTFEPEWLNFHCLSRNVTERNVIKSQSCLGDKPGLVYMNVNYKNVGKTHVDGPGTVPVSLIDNLALTECNLIHLDIEGYEYFALLGAINTIKSFRPVIVIEMWDSLDNRFGESINQQTTDLMSELNYRLVTTLHGSDKVYVPNEIDYNPIKK